MSAEAAVYLDSSALVKLIVRERETAALTRYLRARPRRVSCVLARVEVIPAVRAHGPAAVGRARRILERVSLLLLDDPLLEAAAQLDGPSLRSLDAIHLAAAQTFAPELESVVTYDVRMTAAATALGLRVSSPGYRRATRST